MITILGPTATGKTSIATKLALYVNGEIISADSRQVYRGMDIGTGKDINEYQIDNTAIPYHLIDIHDAGNEYNVFQFQNDFNDVYSDILSRKKTPILCGGSGMYLEAVLSDYELIQTPINKKLREELKELSLAELVLHLEKYEDLHNTTDTKDKERLIRAIEIKTYKNKNTPIPKTTKIADSIVFGIRHERTKNRELITKRLEERLKNGMIEEVELLLNKGVSHEKLRYYGLEYRYISEYLEGKYNRDEMFRLLNIAIHQFAKKQMTWFRRMEKRGIVINWIDGSLEGEEKITLMLKIINMEL